MALELAIDHLKLTYPSLRYAKLTFERLSTSGSSKLRDKMDRAFRFYYATGDQSLDSRADRGRRLAKTYAEKWLRKQGLFYKSRGLSAVVINVVDRMRKGEEGSRFVENCSRLKISAYFA
jgi:hypothetical protein